MTKPPWAWASANDLHSPPFASTVSPNRTTISSLSFFKTFYLDAPIYFLTNTISFPRVTNDFIELSATSSEVLRGRLRELITQLRIDTIPSRVIR